MGGLGRLLGGLWEAFGLGGVLEALGESLDRFLEALGRIWESKWNDFSSKLEEKVIEKSDPKLVSILDGLLIVF